MAFPIGKKPKLNPWGDDNPEKVRSASGESQFKKAAQIMDPGSFMDQLLGIPASEEPSPERLPADEKKRKRQEILLFQYRRKEMERNFELGPNAEIREIVRTLKQQVTLLEKSESSLSRDLAKINVEQLPQKTGIYYLRFFEWLLQMVKQLRAKVEEGQTWLTAITSRRKKMGYWKMYKKHGTSFGLSGERTLATQSG